MNVKREIRLILDSEGKLVQAPMDAKGAKIVLAEGSYDPITQDCIGYKLLLRPPADPEPVVDPGICRIVDGKLKC